jgi:multidrug resistance efflux pump
MPSPTPVQSRTSDRPNPDRAGPSARATRPRLPELPGVERRVQRAVHGMVGFLFLLLALLGVGTMVAIVAVEMEVTVEGRGTLRPLRTWPVRAMSAGLISRVRVSTNDTVQPGEPLVELDALQANSELVQLEAALRAHSASLQYAAARRPLERQKHESARAQSAARLVQARSDLREILTGHGVGAQLDSVLVHHRPGSHVAIDRAVATVRSAEAELASMDAELSLASVGSLDLERQRAELQRLEQQLALARQRLGRLVIPAPAAGVVITDRLEQLYGASVSEGQLLLEIAAAQGWQVDLLVAQRDMSRVRVGDRARIEVVALKATSSQQLPGRVVAIAPEPDRTGVPAADPKNAGPAVGPAAYRLTVELDPAAVAALGPDRLRAGYAVTGYVVTKKERIGVHLWQRLRERV